MQATQSFHREREEGNALMAAGFGGEIICGNSQALQLAEFLKPELDQNQNIDQTILTKLFGPNRLVNRLGWVQNLELLQDSITTKTTST